MSLVQYYKNKDFSKELEYISNIGWRHFRLVLKNGRFQKIRYRIRNDQDMQKILLRYKPTDVYYSSSCFLDPTRLSARTKENKYSSVLLYNDIVFDIDFEPVSLRNLEKARIEALKVLKFMKREPKYIAFSGSKGFHLVFMDEYEPGIADPYEREMVIINKRKELVEKIKNARIRVDPAITVDTRRIIRLPGSINSKTGMTCTIIKKHDLESDIKTILRKIEKTGDLRIKRYNLSAYFPELKKRQKTKEPKRFKTHYSTYLSNSIIGSRNRYVIFLKYENTSMTRARKQFREAVKTNDLPHMMIFRIKNGYVGVCLKSLQRKELLRLLWKTSSENLDELSKFKQNFLELDMTEISKEQKKELKMPIETIYNNSKKKHYCSKGHYRFFRYTGIKTMEPLHGKEDVKLTYAIEQA